MFYNGELESELSEDDSIKDSKFFNSDSDREKFMVEIEERRVFSQYPHDKRGVLCEERGGMDTYV